MVFLKNFLQNQSAKEQKKKYEEENPLKKLTFWPMKSSNESQMYEELEELNSLS